MIIPGAKGSQGVPWDPVRPRGPDGGKNVPRLVAQLADKITSVPKPSILYDVWSKSEFREFR